MFESAELGRSVSKKAFDEAVPALRVELVELQQRLRRADFPVLVLFSGVNGAGKSETIKMLRTAAEALEHALERSAPKGARKVARRKR
jgi:polyphosphate kinase 2 (PPK2 family)